ncbi:unnamed protein product [Trichobilharzia regenti]|nr:unnamed protein product [Trichobilharzia regenti]
MLSKQLIDMPPVTQRLLSYSGTSGGVSGGGGGGGAYDNDDQHTSSIPSSGSPPLIQPAQSILRNLDQDISPPNGLLFSNYREDIDYLFHTTNHHHQQQQQQHHHHQSAAENDSFKG